MLAGEHELEQGGVLGGEAHVGGGGRLQARLELLAGPVGGRPQLVSEADEAGLRERVEQGLYSPIGCSPGESIRNQPQAWRTARAQASSASTARAAL
jgi:hypothetical protein